MDGMAAETGAPRPVSDPRSADPACISRVATDRRIFALLAAVGLFRLFLAARLELSPDEAYYWTWSLRIAPGYYDHPPAIAALIAGGTRLLGHSPIGVRIGPVVLGLATAWLLYRTSLTLFRSPSRALFTLVVMLALPLSTVGGVLATPDAPLVFGWALWLWGSMRSAVEGGRHGRWSIGLGIGIACLAKYTGYWLIPVTLLSYLFSSRGRPRFLIHLPGLGLAGVAIWVNLNWNLHHDWASIRFQFNHGLSSSCLLYTSDAADE